MLAGGCRRLHEVIAHPGVHALLERDAADIDELIGPDVHVHRIVDWPGRGLSIVRPDGYVGFRSGDVRDEQVADWLSLIGGGPASAPPEASHSTRRPLVAAEAIEAPGRVGQR